MTVTLFVWLDCYRRELLTSMWPWCTAPSEFVAAFQHFNTNVFQKHAQGDYIARRSKILHSKLRLLRH